MGCATSKAEDLPAVALCRQRVHHLNSALLLRHLLSDSHLSYSLSLSSLSLSLHHFSLSSSSSTLPPPSSSPLKPTESHHLHLDSDSDISSLHHHSPSPPSSPYYTNHLHHQQQQNLNYMRKHVTPSVSYQQRPPTADTIHFGEFNNHGFNYGYVNGGGGRVEGRVAPPPPPPPVAGNSTWDFLNFFESVEIGGYPSYTPSMDSREVREAEGIPDLENDSFDHRDLVYSGNHNHNNNFKFTVDSRSSFNNSYNGELDGGKKTIKEEGMGPSGDVEYEVHVVEKKVVVGEESKGKKKKKSEVEEGKRNPGFRSGLEVVREIQVQLERASACVNEVGKILDVGKLRYRRKNVAYKG